MEKTTKKISKTNEKLFKILSNISNGIGGTVSYYFIEEKINRETQEIEEHRSVLHTNINSQIFSKEMNGRIYKRSYAEILEVLQDTCNDLGATYFRIN